MISNEQSKSRLERVKFSFGKPFHVFIEQKVFFDIYDYNKFLNWVSGEFDLNLQEESEGLKVFFPFEKLQIKKVETSRDKIQAQIKVESKVIDKAFKLMQKVDSIYKSISLK